MNISLSNTKHRVRETPNNEKNYHKYHVPPFTSSFCHCHVFAFISGYMTGFRHLTVLNSSRRTSSSHPGPMNPSLKGLITSAFESTCMSVKVCQECEKGCFLGPMRVPAQSWTLLRRKNIHNTYLNRKWNMGLWVLGPGLLHYSDIDPLFLSYLCLAVIRWRRHLPQRKMTLQLAGLEFYIPSS